MNPLIGQLIGGAIWLGFELWGVFQKKKNSTSEWVWRTELKWPLFRWLIAGFTISLVGHLLWGWWLLP